MRSIVLVAVLLFLGAKVLAGSVDLPVERLALPVVQGSHLVCVWDDAGQRWLKSFETYDHGGTYEFQLPAWSRWYWVGLWSQTTGEYVFGKWIGHFPTA